MQAGGHPAEAVDAYMRRTANRDELAQLIPPTAS
jgi:hypothetical protein